MRIASGLAVVLLVAGAGTVGYGLAGRAPESAPLPARTFTVPPAQSRTPEQAPTLGPRRLAVPSLGVNAALEDRPLTALGDLSVPDDPAVVARWDGSSPLLAAGGTTMLAGHVSFRGVRGALHDLYRIEPGALVYASDEEGNVSSWRVSEVNVVAKNQLPAFRPKGGRNLLLVTCGGPVIRGSEGLSFRDNVIVTALPSSASDAAAGPTLTSHDAASRRRR